jgi:hypothetical protein
LARLSGVISIGILMLTLASCGSDERASAERNTTPPSTTTAAKSSSKRETCQSQIGGFLRSLNILRRRLAIGLSYDRYLYDVRKVRTAYAEIPTDRLTLDCLINVATPAEQALNRYIAAVNIWGDCLATPDCSSSTVEPDLQRTWRQASTFVSKALEKN